MPGPTFRQLRLDQLNLPEPQLRSERHKLEELASSIEELGVLVPLVVREPMRPFDEAETARVLVREYGYTQTRVAKALGLTQATVSRQLAVFALDRSVVAALRKGEIEMRLAMALLPLQGDKSAQRKLLAAVRKRGLSAAQPERADERIHLAPVTADQHRVGVGRGSGTERRGNFEQLREGHLLGGLAHAARRNDVLVVQDRQCADLVQPER